MDPAEVAATAEALIQSLSPQRSLVVATLSGDLAGRLNISRNPDRLVANWGTLHQVQTRLAVRGQGLGEARMRRAREAAGDMELEQLHLAARGGVGREHYYQRLGWTEIGRRTRRSLTRSSLRSRQLPFLLAFVAVGIGLVAMGTSAAGTTPELRHPPDT